MEQNNLPDECPGCGATEITTDPSISGSVCGSCGMVYDGSEWPTETAKQVGTQDRGKTQTTDESNWQEQIEVEDQSDQQLVTILSDLDDAANSLDLASDTRATAADVVTEAWTHNITHGRRTSSIVAGTIYLICRKTGEPRPSHVIADVAQAEEEQVHNTSRVLARQLDIDVSPNGPCGYLSYLTDELDTSEITAQRASKKLTRTGSIGGEPAAIAAAALYLVSRQKTDSITLSEAGDAAGVTKETVWRHTTAFD